MSTNGDAMTTSELVEGSKLKAATGAERRARDKSESEIALDTRILNDNISAAINASERLHWAARKKLQALGLDAGGVVSGNGTPRGEVVATSLSEEVLIQLAKGLVPFLRAEIRDAVTPLRERIAELERQAVKYEGVWNDQKTYSAGTMVTFQGGMWYCTDTNWGVRPGSGSSSWTLANKSRR